MNNLSNVMKSIRVFTPVKDVDYKLKVEEEFYNINIIACDIDYGISFDQSMAWPKTMIIQMKDDRLSTKYLESISQMDLNDLNKLFLSNFENIESNIFYETNSFYKVDSRLIYAENRQFMYSSNSLTSISEEHKICYIPEHVQLLTKLTGDSVVTVSKKSSCFYNMKEETFRHFLNFKYLNKKETELEQCSYKDIDFIF